MATHCAEHYFVLEDAISPDIGEILGSWDCHLFALCSLPMIAILSSGLT